MNNNSTPFPVVRHTMRLAAIVLCVTLGIVWGQNEAAARAEQSTNVATAQSTPSLLDLSLPDLEGQPHALADLRGQVVVINFWATWCPPCVKEIPEFIAAHAQFAHQPVHFVGIGIDQPEAMQAFRERFTIPYQLLVGNSTTLSLAAKLGNPARALPFTMIYDTTGQLREVKLGTLNEAELAGKIRPLLSESAENKVPPN